MTTTADFNRQDRIAREYGVVETGMPVGPEYHSSITEDMTLSELAAAGGKITRVRLLHERGMFDISYIHGQLPSGQGVRLNLQGCPDSFLIPRRTFKGVMIEWAKAEGVFAKGLGLLDDGNYSILW